MTKKEFLKLQFDKPTCTGDQWHNDDLNLLITDLKVTPTLKKIWDFVRDEMEERDTRWVHQTFTKGELQRLRVIATAKSESTREKRKLRYIKLVTNSCYGYLLNKSKIERFCKIFKMEDLFE
jgi:hypothetical protein